MTPPKAQRPTVLARPAAFLVTGPAGAWVWETGHGFVKVVRPFAALLDGLHFELQRDGRALRYRSNGLPGTLSQRWVLNLMTGEETEETPLPLHEEVFLGPGDRACFVEMTDVVATQFTRSTYRISLPNPEESIAPDPVPIVPEDGLYRLPTTFLRGSNWSGRPVQFSPSGTQLAINFQWWGNPVPAVDIINFDGSWGRRRYGFEITSSASWNASGSHLLGVHVNVGQVVDFTVTVLDVEKNKIVASLKYPADLDWVPLGWAGNSEVLCYKLEVRAMRLAATDVFSTHEEEVATIKLPFAGQDLGTIELASDVALEGLDSFRI